MEKRSHFLQCCNHLTVDDNFIQIKEFVMSHVASKSQMCSPSYVNTRRNEKYIFFCFFKAKHVFFFQIFLTETAYYISLTN